MTEARLGGAAENDGMIHNLSPAEAKGQVGVGREPVDVELPRTKKSIPEAMRQWRKWSC